MEARILRQERLKDDCPGSRSNRAKNFREAEFWGKEIGVGESGNLERDSRRTVRLEWERGDLERSWSNLLCFLGKMIKNKYMKNNT